MAVTTVNVTVSVVDQGGAAFHGYVRATLIPGASASGTTIVSNASDVRVAVSDGAAVLPLVPSTLLAEDSYYAVELTEVYSDPFAGSRERHVWRKLAQVPNADCSLTDCIILAPIKPIPVELHEQYLLDAKEARAEAIAAQTASETAQAAAEASQSAAASSESVASASATTATEKAGAAGDSATSAAASASAAAVSEADASVAATTATEQASLAGTAATTATAKAEAASASAEAAAISAGTASTESTAAKAASADAKVSASSAQARATEAQSYAQTATDKATAAEKAATSAAGSAATASEKATVAVSSADTAGSARTAAETARDAAAASASEASAAVDMMTGQVAAHDANEAAHSSIITPIKGDISALEDRATDLENDASTASEERDILKRRVRNLELASQGITHTVEEDSDTAYCKTVPSGAMPNCILDSIGGRSLVWNQLVPDPRKQFNNTVMTCTLLDSGVFEYEITGSTNYPYGVLINNDSFTSGHKYYINFTSDSDAYSKGFRVFLVENSTVATRDITSKSEIIERTDTDKMYIQLYWRAAEVGAKAQIKAICIDLTKMFGAGNEPTTNADIEQLISEKDYWEYNEGEVISGDVQTVESVGRNITQSYTSGVTTQWSIGLYIMSELKQDTDYVLSWDSTSSGNKYYCNEHLFSSVVVITETSGKRSVIKFHTLANIEKTLFNYNKTKGYIILKNQAEQTNTPTFVNLQLEEGSTATTYSPYQSSTLTIPSAITSLPGYGWSAGTAKNYVDYDNRKYVQEVGVVLFSLSNYIDNVATYYYNVGGTSSPLFDAKEFATSGLCGSISSDYNLYNVHCNTNSDFQTGTSSMSLAYQIHPNGKGIRFKDSTCSDSNSFLSKLVSNNVKIYYELATQIETPFRLIKADGINDGYIMTEDEASEFTGKTLADIIPDSTMLTVEEGGTLTFKSTSDLHIAVPSTESYMVKTTTE